MINAKSPHIMEDMAKSVSACWRVPKESKDSKQQTSTIHAIASPKKVCEVSSTPFFARPPRPSIGETTRHTRRLDRPSHRPVAWSGPITHRFSTWSTVPILWKRKICQGSLYYQPKQCIVITEFPQNYNTFALIDSSKMGNLMIPVCDSLLAKRETQPAFIGFTMV